MRRKASWRRKARGPRLYGPRLFTRRHLLAVLLCWAVHGVPVAVKDGDTLVADLSVWHGITARETIRLLGVDTPELKGSTRPAGEKAKKFTEDWLAGGPFTLDSCKKDSFGRVLGIVTRVGKGNLNEDLIKSGNAVPFNR